MKRIIKTLFATLTLFAPLSLSSCSTEKTPAATLDALSFTYDEDTDSYFVFEADNNQVKEVVIPATHESKQAVGVKSVVAIGYMGFRKSKLTSIVLPDSIYLFRAEAFYDCRALASINMPSKLKTIEEHAFFRCIGITSLVLPDTVEEIGDFAFGSSGLTSITLGKGLKKIGKDILGTENLKSVTYNSTVEDWNKIQKHEEWDKNIPSLEIQCTNGTVSV